MLGIEAVPSQSTRSRFFAQCGRQAGEASSGLHRWALAELPARAEGYTLDLDLFSLLHEDGHQEGVRVGYTRKGLKPCESAPPEIGIKATRCAVIRGRRRFYSRAREKVFSPPETE